jgi:hypothetical protein
MDLKNELADDVAIPPIDLKVPNDLQTATFALG